MDPYSLSQFEPIALKEMNSVSLLKRIDTKFLTTETKLLEVLPYLQNDYRIFVAVNAGKTRLIDTLKLGRI